MKEEQLREIHNMLSETLTAVNGAITKRTYARQMPQWYTREQAEEATAKAMRKLQRLRWAIAQMQQFTLV